MFDPTGSTFEAKTAQRHLQAAMALVSDERVLLHLRVASGNLDAVVAGLATQPSIAAQRVTELVAANGLMTLPVPVGAS